MSRPHASAAQFESQAQSGDGPRDRTRRHVPDLHTPLKPPHALPRPPLPSTPHCSPALACVQASCRALPPFDRLMPSLLACMLDSLHVCGPYVGEAWDPGAVGTISMVVGPTLSPGGTPCCCAPHGHADRARARALTVVPPARATCGRWGRVASTTRCRGRRRGAGVCRARAYMRVHAGVGARMGAAWVGTPSHLRRDDSAMARRAAWWWCVPCARVHADSCGG